jgi:hypothetical protein
VCVLASARVVVDMGTVVVFGAKEPGCRVLRHARPPPPHPLSPHSHSDVFPPHFQRGPGAGGAGGGAGGPGARGPGGPRYKTLEAADEAIA